ncbi:MAG: methyltransferase domain-containing protein, partial [Acidimicrobiia bacterium]
VASALQQDGSPPIAYVEQGFAVLGGVAVPEGQERTGMGLEEFPSETADLVVLRHAWDSRPGLNEILAQARRVLKPGGVAVTAELDFDRLLNSSTHLYPSRLQFLAHPELADAMADRFVDPADLNIELVRHGFRYVSGFDVDEEAGTFPDHRSYLEHVRSRGWRTFPELSDEQVEALLVELGRVLPRIAPLGEVTEREPWQVAHGSKPGR